LLVYRAAYTKDTTSGRVTREASEAKLFATEAAGRIIDSAVQIHGGAGLVRGSVVERLYRDIRALRIYEGTSEIQKLVIAGQLLRDHREGNRA
jgi:acyl-CoA dehydrogenase